MIVTVTTFQQPRSVCTRTRSFSTFTKAQQQRKSLTPGDTTPFLFTEGKQRQLEAFIKRELGRIEEDVEKWEKEKKEEKEAKGNSLSKSSVVKRKKKGTSKHKITEPDSVSPFLGVFLTQVTSTSS
jgi:hypothetical protein